jgi:cytochrome c oxidase assembly protein subunit 11
VTAPISAPRAAPGQVRGKRRNAVLAFACAGLVAGMVGLTYASVPLYRLFCQVTGFAGTTQVATSAPAEALDQSVTVRFDANVSRDLNWTFQPVERSVDVKIGETRLAYYRAVNRADHPVTGTATFNVTPDWAGAYFNKIACFCFTEQTLQPGESVDMPVVFFVDPAIADDRSASRGLAITLSYTFYRVAGADKPLAAAPAAPVPANPPGSG